MPEKKKVSGVVDRVEGDTAVVVVKDPDSGDNREVYVDKKKLKKVDLKEGDEVSVEMSLLAIESNSVSLFFSGLKSKEMAKRFFTYLVDGGLEDQLIQTLSGKGLTLEIKNSNKKNLTVNFHCLKEKPANKTVKKPAKVKTPVKKTSAKRPKKR